MARDYAKTNLTIWQDPDWRSLPYPAQHLYKMLWEHPALSYCGVVDWRPAKMLGWGAGWTRPDLDALTACLRARHFLVIDEDTEECLVRSWVRFDGILKQPRLTVSMCNAFGDVGSNDLRGVLVDELHKLRNLEPDAAGWAKPQMTDLLGFPRVSAKTLDVPTDPFGSGFAIAFGSVSGAFGPNATSGLGSGLGSPYNSNSTITTTPLHPGVADEVLPAGVPEVVEDPTSSGASKKKPARPLPVSWVPTAKHLEAASRGIDVVQQAEAFRLHAEAHDRRAVNWNAAFSQWLLKARPDSQAQQPSRVRSLDEYLQQEKQLREEHDRRHA